MATEDEGESSGRVEQLARTMTNAKYRIEKKLKHNLRLAEKHQIRANTLEKELKILKSDVEVALGTKEFKVSLLHKRVGVASYIKGRCWWRGKQREVQIGSIPSVLDRINHMIEKGECGDLELLENSDLSWQELKSDEALIKVVKDMGRARLRKYILKKLFSEHIDLDSDDGIPEPTSDDSDSDQDISTHQDTYKASIDEWYVRWRRDNL